MNYTISFNYEGSLVTILGNKNDKMEDIFKKYCCKIDSDKTELFFLYNGERVNNNLTLGQISSNNDKIEILVVKTVGADIDISFDEKKNKIIFNINYNDKITKIECKPEEKNGRNI